MQRVPLYRVVVFVPVPALEAVKQGILSVDALVAGDYEHGIVPHHPWQVPVVQVEEIELLLAG